MCVTFGFASLGVGLAEPTPLTLVYEQVDANGFPMNPTWAYQIGGFPHEPAANYTPNANCPTRYIANKDLSKDACAGSLLLADRACNHFLFEDLANGFNKCSSDKVYVDERPRPSWWFASGFVAFACYYQKDGAQDPQDLLPGSIYGHIDWQPVTYSGELRFSDSNQVGGSGPRWPRWLQILPAGDGDLDFMLEADAHYAGLLAGNRTAHRVGDPGNDGLTVEMNIPEFLSKISSLPYWSYVSAHLGELARATNSPAPRSAIVVGLLGIDTKHLSHTELHPVYGIALASPKAKDEVEWEIFARNWGYEGGCSASPHPLVVPSPLTAHAVVDQSGFMRTLMFTLPITTHDTIERFESDTATQTWEVLPRDNPDSLTVLAHLDAPEDRSVKLARITVRIAPLEQSSGGGRK